MSQLNRRLDVAAAGYRSKGYIPKSPEATKAELRRELAQAALNTTARAKSKPASSTTKEGPRVLIPWSPIAGPLCYLASPFTRYPLGHDRAESDIARLAGILINTGVRLYCPIAHCGPLVRHGGLDPVDAKLWRAVNEPFVRLCTVLIVARLEGWNRSDGVAGETFEFHERRAPIFDLCPKSLVMTRRS
jgi:hypothetical protein